VLKESGKGQNAFLDNEAEVSGGGGGDDDDEDEADDEDEVVEAVACGEPQGTDPREKGTFREGEADLPGDGSEAGETLPDAE
jgi:hypothetical protein